MGKPLPESIKDARNHLLAAMGSLATAMTQDQRLNTTPVKVLLQTINRTLQTLDHITSPF